MMLAPVHLTDPFCQACARLRLATRHIETLKAHLTLSPLRIGHLIYPALSVLHLHREAGLYEADLELRDNGGMPFLLRIRYIFTSRRLPLIAVQVFLLVAGVSVPPPTIADLAQVEEITYTLSSALA